MEQHHVAAYLITAAVGYWIVTLAGKEQKTTKSLGQLLGWAIVVVSVCGLLCTAACRVMSSCSSMGMGSGYSCPYSGGSKMACPDMKDMKGMDGMKGMMHGHEGDPGVPAEAPKKATK